MAWKLVGKLHRSEHEYLLLFHDETQPEIMMFAIRSTSGEMVKALRRLGVHNYYSDAGLACGGPLPIGRTVALSGVFFAKSVLVVPKVPKAPSKYPQMKATDPNQPEVPSCGWQASFNRLMNEPEFRMKVAKQGMNPFARGSGPMQSWIHETVRKEMQLCEKMSFRRP